MAKITNFLMGRREEYPPIDYHRDAEEEVLEERALDKLVQMGERFPDVVKCLDEMEKRMRKIEENGVVEREREQRVELRGIVSDEVDGLAERLYVDRRHEIEADVPREAREVRQKPTERWYGTPQPKLVDVDVPETVITMPAERQARVYSEESPVRYWRDITDNVLGSDSDESVYTGDESKYKLENVTVIGLVKTLRDAVDDRNIEVARHVTNNLLDKLGQYLRHKMKHDSEIDFGLQQDNEELGELKQIVINKDNEIATLKEAKLLAEMKALELATKLNVYEHNLGYATTTRTPAEEKPAETPAPVSIGGAPVPGAGTSDVTTFLLTGQNPALPRINAVRIIRNERGDMVCSFAEGLKRGGITQERYDEAIEELSERLIAYLKKESIDSPSTLFRPVKATRKLVAMAFEDMGLPILLKSSIIEDVLDPSRVGKYIGANRVALPQDTYLTVKESVVEKPKKEEEEEKEENYKSVNEGLGIEKRDEDDVTEPTTPDD